MATILPVRIAGRRPAEDRPVDHRRNADIRRAHEKHHEREHAAERVAGDYVSGRERPSRDQQEYGAHSTTETGRHATPGQRTGPSQVADTVVVDEVEGVHG